MQHSQMVMTVGATDLALSLTLLLRCPERNMAKRVNPAKQAIARVGNYAAPVDTSGMDESMKKTMEINKKKPAKKQGFIASMKTKMGIKY